MGANEWNAAKQRRRQGIGLPGMGVASDVVVRSLDGTVLRVERAQEDAARRPMGVDVAPVPQGPEIDPRPEPEVAYSFDRAYRYARAQADLPEGQMGGGFTTEKFAQMAGVSISAAMKWRHLGRIPRDAADDVAIGLGLHPVMLWPEWLTDGLAEAERFDTDKRVRERDRERRVLLGWVADEPTRADWQYEMRLRTSAAGKRKRRHDDAEYGRNEVARNTKYRQENSDAINAQRRRHAAENREKLNAQKRAWNNTPERRKQARAVSRAYYAANRERLLAAQAERDRAKRARREAS